MRIVCDRISRYEKLQTCCAGARVPLQAASAPAPSSSLPNADLLFIISANQVKKAPLLFYFQIAFTVLTRPHAILVCAMASPFPPRVQLGQPEMCSRLAGILCLHAYMSVVHCSDIPCISNILCISNNHCRDT